jgi:monothiol glutaredoxin
MQPSEVEQLIKNGIPDATILVDGEGCNFSVVVISDQFKGQSLVKKQQLVLSTVKDKIATGELHAMSVKGFTVAEWDLEQTKQKDPDVSSQEINSELKIL